MAITHGLWQNTDYVYYVKKIDRSVTLNGDLTASATTIPATGDISGFASSGYLQIDDEQITYTGKTTNSFTGCTRGATYPSGTMAATHTSGATIYELTKTQRSTTTCDYFADDASVGDAIYFGSRGSWDIIKGIRVNVGTARDGDITLVWEYNYYTSSTDFGWTAMPTVTDPTSGFTVTGVNDITWDNNSIDPAKPYIAGNIPLGMIRTRYIRCRISAVTTPITEGGAQQTSYIQNNQDCIYIDSGTEASPVTIADVYSADVAGSWGLINRSGNSNKYSYEITRCIKQGSTSAFSAQSCVLNFNLWNQSGAHTAIELANSANVYCLFGTLSNGHSATEADLNFSANGLITGGSAVVGWKQYGGIMSRGTFISMGPYIQHEVKLQDANYSNPSTGARLRDVIIHRIGDGLIVFSGAGTTISTYGLTFLGGQCPIRATQTSAGSSTVYNIKQAGCLYPYKAWWPISGTHTVYIKGFEGPTSVFYLAGAGSAGAKIVYQFEQPLELTVIDTDGNAIDGATVAVTDYTGAAISSSSTGTTLFKDTTSITSTYFYTSLDNQPTTPIRLGITVSGISLASAQVRITGTDIQDLAISETINIDRGNGTYWTTDKFKTVDVNGVFVYNGNGGTIKVHMEGKIYQQYLVYKTVEVRYEDSTGYITDPTRHVFYTPHTITISKTGYQTKTIKYTMDRKREEIEKLTPDGTNIYSSAFYDSVIY